MPKQSTQFPLVLPPRAAGEPATRWLYGALRRGILEGRLRPGARLPATRDLAAHYGLARGTIVLAFDLLKSEGYLDATVGSGTYVARVLPGRQLTGHSRRSAAAPRPRAPSLSDYARRVRPFGNLRGPIRAFRSNLPALDLFPMAVWARLTARRIRRATPDLLQGCEAMGYPPLQEAVAEYLSASRGVSCSPAQVAILSGVQEALDLVARMVLDRGDRVALEDPGYIGATRVFEAIDAEIIPLRLDDEGAVFGDSTLAGARLVYVTPAHQFPIGVSMSLSRRLALLEWARATGALIFEDDYDSEYRYSGRPVPALQGLDRQGQVVFAGSFSKVLFPSLRMGYLVVPPDLIERVGAALSITQRHAPLLQQAVLADFITDGSFGRHIRRMREVYGERLETLLQAGRERLRGLLEISPVEAGLQTVGWLGEGINGEAAAAAASQRNVLVTPLARYGRSRLARDGLQLGFAAVDAREIRRGVRDLALALEGEQRSTARRA